MRLNCLGPVDVPGPLARDLRALLSLPDSARRDLWRALGPSLDEPVDPGLEALLDAFVAEHQCDASALARALKAARFLLREAARRDTPAEAFAADLRTLVGDDSAGLNPLLLRGYPRVLRRLREALTHNALRLGARVVTGLAWRVATVTDSHEATGLDARVATLSLRYDDAGRARTVTLELGPEHAEALRALADSLDGGPSRG